MGEWQLQDASNDFGAVVDAALSGEPQHVVREGRRVVVVLSADEYGRLRRLDSASAPTFPELLLEMPQDDGEFERLPFQARNVIFE